MNFSLPEGMLQNAIFGMVIAFVSVMIYRVLRARHLSRESRLDFDELLLDSVTGKPSKPAAVMFTALLVTSLVVLYQTFKGTLTDVVFGLYLGGWVAPTLTKIYKGDPGDPQPPAAGPTTTISTDTVNLKP